MDGAQIARNLTDCEDGYGIEVLLTACLAPNMNACAERFVKSITSECFDQMIFLGRESLVRVITAYAAQQPNRIFGHCGMEYRFFWVPRQ